jgi:hypothetical protein
MIRTVLCHGSVIQFVSCLTPCLMLTANLRGRTGRGDELCFTNVETKTRNNDGSSPGLQMGLSPS